MSHTNEQELREQITPLVIEAIKNDLLGRYYGDEIGDDTWHFMHSIITAHTNAEIAKVLDRLELGMRGKTIVDTPEGWKRFVEIYVNDAIEAERAKLKEVK